MQEDTPHINHLSVWAKLEINLAHTKKIVKEIAHLRPCHRIRQKRKSLWRICPKMVFICVYSSILYYPRYFQLII